MTLRRPKRIPRSSDGKAVAGFVRVAATWFLGLAGLYTLYMWSAFHGLGDQGTVLERLIMVVGPTTVALACLISPAVFAAALNSFDLLGGDVDGGQGRCWAQLVLFAGAAYLLSALGPMISVSLLAGIEGSSFESATPISGSVFQVARVLMPVAIGILTIVSGCAGALVGRASRHWRSRPRNVTRWFACLALMASFLFPFLAAVNAIVIGGAPAVWVIAGPVALPLSLTAILAWPERRRLVLPILRRQNTSEHVDAEAVDRIVSTVVEDPESVVESAGQTEPEFEMAQLAAAIRRLAAPRATISEYRARKIVAKLLEASPTFPKHSRPRWSRIEPGSVSRFCTSWTCLAVGLLIVSPLGGVPISVVPAVAVGFLGSAGIVVVARRCPELSSTVPT